MNPNNNSIITEDGQRLTINNGLITGTENPGAGLAYETGNVVDEDKESSDEERKIRSIPADKNADDSKT